MNISQQDYYLRTGESIEAYNARIAELRKIGETQPTDVLQNQFSTDTRNTYVGPAPAPAAPAPLPYNTTESKIRDQYGGLVDNPNYIAGSGFSGIVPATTTTPISTLSVPPPTQPVPQPAPQVGGAQPQPQSTPLTQQQYFLQPGETPEQYNQRIAQLRGDTPENLARVQQLTQQKTGAGFQQTSQQLAGQPQSIQSGQQSIQPAQLPSADG